MNDISMSPDRGKFQIESYVKRCEADGKIPRADYLEIMEASRDKEKTKFLDLESQINNMEYDLRTTDWILKKVRESDDYAQNLYAAMCNNDFTKNEIWPILQDNRWSCSWRYAGGIIANMQEKGDYNDWYCSGIRNDTDPEETIHHYVPESVVTQEIREDLLKLGWIVHTDDSDE
jgi:hypothetical protein